MLTALGKQLRIFRIKKGELLKDMAERLNVTPAYLSSVENGKRTPTKSLITQIVKTYMLDDGEKEELMNAFYESINEVQISIESSSDDKKQLGLVFARRFDNLSKKQVDNLIKILYSEEDD